MPQKPWKAFQWTNITYKLFNVQINSISLRTYSTTTTTPSNWFLPAVWSNIYEKYYIFKKENHFWNFLNPYEKGIFIIIKMIKMSLSLSKATHRRSSCITSRPSAAGHSLLWPPLRVFLKICQIFSGIQFIYQICLKYYAWESYSQK